MAATDQDRAGTHGEVGSVKIAFVNTRMPGINTFLIRDLRMLLRLGVRIDLYLFEVESLDADFRREIEDHGGVVERLPFPFGGGGPLRLLAELLRRPHVLCGDFAKILRWTLRSPAEGVRALAVLPVSLVLRDRVEARGVERIHALWAGVPATAAFWAARHSQLEFSISAHAWDLLQRTAGLREKVAASERMVVCSDFARETAQALVGLDLASRIELVHHGLDLSDWSFAEKEAQRPDELQILAVGRLMPKKGFEHLVAACGRLQDRSVPFRCRLVGPDGGLGGDLAARIAALGLEGRVTLEGGRAPAEVKRAMVAADILCCPSVQTETSSDGIPNVVLEALAVGTPVVATDAGGLAEVVRPGETGWRVPQRDVAALAEALVAAWTQWDRTREQARAGRKLVESSFDAEGTARQFLAEIGLGRAILERRSHAPAHG